MNSLLLIRKLGIFNSSNSKIKKMICNKQSKFSYFVKYLILKNIKCLSIKASPLRSAKFNLKMNNSVKLLKLLEKMMMLKEMRIEKLAQVEI